MKRATRSRSCGAWPAAAGNAFSASRAKCFQCAAGFPEKKTALAGFAFWRRAPGRPGGIWHDRTGKPAPAPGARPHQPAADSLVRLDVDGGLFRARRV